MPGRRRGDIRETARLRLERFLDELEQWRGRINLTTVPRSAAWDRHVVESQHLLAAASPRPGVRVVDVGAGSGVPGIVVAVLRPDLALTLVEADRRKAGFLVHVAGLLALTNVRVDPRRAEVVGRDPSCRESWEVVISRAAAPAPVLCELALPLLRSGGDLWALVSDADDAVRACTRLPAALGGGPPRAAGPGLLHLKKVGPTGDGFPRRRPEPSRDVSARAAG